MIFIDLLNNSQDEQTQKAAVAVIFGL